MTKEEAKEMLTNTKVYVNGKSKEIQEKLFEIGFKWSSGSGQDVSFTNAPFLFIKEDIFYSFNMQTFKEESEREVSAEDILNIKIDEEFNLKDGGIFCSVDTFGYHWISIFNRLEKPKYFTHLDLCTENCNLYSSGVHWFSKIGNITNVRLATEEEKEKLFFALKKQGLFWNEGTKQVEKIKKEHEFKPFDRVLVRDFGEDNWNIEFFQEIGGEDIGYQFICLAAKWNFCIPYEGNEHLLGTSNSPEE